MRTLRNCLSLLVFVVAFPALAADNGFYLGGSLGRSAVNTGTVGSVSINSDATAWKAFAGYRFLHFLAIEGAYNDLGSVAENIGMGENKARIKAYHGDAMALLPFGLADLFAKAGVMSWKTDVTAAAGTVPVSSSNSGTDPIYGAGMQFRIQSWAVRGEVEYLDIKNAEHVYMYSIGASYTW